MCKIYNADLESSGLLHDLIEQGDKAKLHNFCAKSVETGEMWTLHANTEKEKETLSKFLNREIILIMHNGICYDKNALTHFGYDVSKIHFVDTLALSWYLDLNRQGSSVTPPKGKEDEPFWNSISLSHLRGSGGLEQLSWNVLSLEREYLPNKKRGRVRWGILKNREFGDLGIADVFSLNDVDWSIQLYDDETTEVANTANIKKSVVVVDDDEDEIPF